MSSTYGKVLIWLLLVMFGLFAFSLGMEFDQLAVGKSDSTELTVYGLGTLAMLWLVVRQIRKLKDV